MHYKRDAIDLFSGALGAHTQRAHKIHANTYLGGQQHAYKHASTAAAQLKRR